MAYTVKELAKISGVSIRTLHWYDEIGLLQPAYTGGNGYRYYEHEQLLLLQQILFFRELGFELKQIKKILGRSDFDQMVALSSHREVLQKQIVRTKKLVKTIDKTLKHLKGEIKMKDQEMYLGFSREIQAEYEKQIIDRFGQQGKTAIEESKKNIEHWSKADWKEVKEQFAKICRDLVSCIKNNVSFEDKEVQKIIAKHFAWLSKFWTPTKETYAQHGKFIEESELRKAYEEYHPHLPQYICRAIEYFAQHSL